MLLAVLASLVGVVSAQSYVNVTGSRALYPTAGVYNSSYSIDSTIPLACLNGCWDVSGPYFFCFVNTTLPSQNGAGQQQNQTFCDEYLCQPDRYTQLSQCLNCIVANGDERPFGYSTNTSITAAPTQGPGPFPYNPNGLINITQGNGILKNVTDRCSSVGKALSDVATTLTASPTTTGPYESSWASGATVTPPVWTGLTQYGTPYVTVVARVSASSGASGSGTGAAGAGSASSSPPAASSSKSAGEAGIKAGGSGILMVLLGAMMAVL